MPLGHENDNKGQFDFLKRKTKHFPKFDLSSTAHPADQSLFVAFSENPINQRFIGSVDRQEKATKRDKNINGSAGWALKLKTFFFEAESYPVNCMQFTGYNHAGSQQHETFVNMKPAIHEINRGFHVMETPVTSLQMLKLLFRPILALNIQELVLEAQSISSLGGTPQKNRNYSKIVNRINFEILKKKNVQQTIEKLIILVKLKISSIEKPNHTP